MASRISGLLSGTTLALSLFIAASCGNNNHQATVNITGKWESDISTPDFSGKEYMNLLPDSSVTVTDSLTYRANDRKMEVSLGCIVTTSGKWNLKGDSLILDLGNTTVETDSTSFRAGNMIQDNTEFSAETLAGMKKDFCTAISTELHEAFSGRSSKKMTLGRVMPVGTDTLLLTNGPASLILKRTK